MLAGLFNVATAILCLPAVGHVSNKTEMLIWTLSPFFFAAALFTSQCAV
jgi:hypothetical protein